MTPRTHHLLHWGPRALAIAFIAFLAVFALDVFQEGLGFWKTTAAFLIHLLPNAIVLAALLVAWRWRLLGGALFVALAGFYVATAWGRFDWTAYAAIAGPLAVIGALFIVDAALHRHEPARLAH